MVQYHRINGVMINEGQFENRCNKCNGDDNNNRSHKNLSERDDEEADRKEDEWENLEDTILLLDCTFAMLVV